MFDLRKIFDLRKFFAVPKNFLKLKIHCITIYVLLWSLNKTFFSLSVIVFNEVSDKEGIVKS